MVTKPGAGSRDLLLDVAERLMGAKGYSATAVSAICREAGVPVTSLYWHFGSKDGLLATVMERGAQRWFAALPRWEELDGTADVRAETILSGGADAVASHPDFLRLFYTLALEGRDDEIVTELVGRVRLRAVAYFREPIERILATEYGPDIARGAADELARFAVAFSDGCFFALQLEPEQTDIKRLFTDLAVGLRALAPAAIARARERSTCEEGTA